MNKGNFHQQQAKRESAGLKREQAKTVKVNIYHDKPSKPKTANKHAKGTTEFVAVPHPDPTSGYKGKLVPATPAAKRASKALAKANVPANPSLYIGNSI